MNREADALSPVDRRRGPAASHPMARWLRLAIGDAARAWALATGASPDLYDGPADAVRLGARSAGEQDPGEWLRTGGPGHVDACGLLHVTGRQELIKYKGLQVPPAELEAVLLRHPDVTSSPALSCAPASGTVFAIGTTTVTCAATDADDAHSPVTASFTITVHGAAAQLTELAKAILGVGPGDSLADKVARARAYLAAGDTSGVCDALAGFTGEVTAQSGKTIPAVKAAALIAAARQIQAILAC